MPLIDNEIVPLIYERWSDEFAAKQWGTQFDSSFQVAQQIDAVLREAGATGKSVFVMVALIPTEKVFPPLAEEVTEETSEESSDPVTDEPAV